METIFVQIAAYRDPQLIPTIDDCISNAKHPSRLRFGICNQTDDLSELNGYCRDSRFRITCVPHEDSNGVCWARHLIQTQHYDDETYTLQLDAHHRFVKGWDEKLVSMLGRLQSKGFEKPLITSYAPHCDPFARPERRVQEVWIMNFDRFMPEGAVLFAPHAVADSAQLKEPIPARFYSGHFGFTLGRMCSEVPHDPNYYFFGEEISVGVRAYTHGYDLFHPNETILWHYYTKERAKHNYDHRDIAEELNRSSHRRNRILFGMDPNLNNLEFGEYGFGANRSLAEYERYAGVRFRDRTVQRYTLQNKLAPNPADDEWVCMVKHFIYVAKKALTEKDYEAWLIEFQDGAGDTVYREEANKAEIEELLSTEESFISIKREFLTKTLPVRWAVKPRSASKGWCDLINGVINYN
jgi:hypothetical protein